MFILKTGNIRRFIMKMGRNISWRSHFACHFVIAPLILHLKNCHNHNLLRLRRNNLSRQTPNNLNNILVIQHTNRPFNSTILELQSVHSLLLFSLRSKREPTPKEPRAIRPNGEDDSGTEICWIWAVLTSTSLNNNPL